MRNRILTLGTVAVMAATASVTRVDVAGQAAPARRPVTAAGGVPRTADGHPDLQGTYDLGTITPLERRAGTPLVLTDEDAKQVAKARLFPSGTWTLTVTEQAGWQFTNPAEIKHGRSVEVGYKDADAVVGPRGATAQHAQQCGEGQAGGNAADNHDSALACGYRHGSCGSVGGREGSSAG